MMTVGNTDHVQTDVSNKINQVADLTRHTARRGVNEGWLGPDMLQCINENGRLFQELIKPILIKVGTIGCRLVDSDLLEPISVVDLPAIEAFKAKGHFEIGTQDGVKIGWLDDNFQEHFLSDDGKSETEVPGASLRIHKIRKCSVDGPIITELGGEELAETTLSHMWEMMKKQGNGQRGCLLTNRCTNVFYIRDGKGTLWSVSCAWRSDSWFVRAYSITYPGEWNAGRHQILSP